MDFNQLITSEIKEANFNVAKFAASVALKVLQDSASLSSLFSTGDIREKLKSIKTESTELKPRFSFTLLSHQNLEADFLHQCSIQRKILSCPNNDEHVVFLAALKSLELEKKDFSYSIILKELLKKNLHKLHDFSSEVEFIGRTKEIENILRVINLSERNNALIIGPSGVGKTALTKTIMRLASDRKTFQLFPGSDTLEDQVLNILSSSDQKVLFLLDEIFSFSTAQISFLIDKAQVIATSSEASYRKFAAEQSGLISKFDISILSEPVADELRAILSVHQERITKQIQAQYGETTIEEIIKLTKQHISELSFPAKAIGLMEEAAHFAKAQNETEVTPEMIRVIVSQKANIPIASLTDFDKKDLSQLDERIYVSKVKIMRLKKLHAVFNARD